MNLKLKTPASREAKVKRPGHQEEKSVAEIWLKQPHLPRQQVQMNEKLRAAGKLPSFVDVPFYLFIYLFIYLFVFLFKVTCTR